MKKAKHFFTIGITGLSVSLVLFFVMKFFGINYNIIPYTIPWVVFLIIGISIKLKYVWK
ncbi:MAG: hypothetical protein RIM99_18015 [Cyclobacteriaceae bacterium]